MYYFLHNIPTIQSRRRFPSPTPVYITISRQMNQVGTEKIFDETLYPDSDGYIYLSDIPTLVEPYIREMGNISVCIFYTWEKNRDTIQFNVIPSEVRINADCAQWVNDHFLTLSRRRRTSLGRTELLHFYNTRGNKVFANIIYNGISTRQTLHPLTETIWGLWTVDVSPSQFIKQQGAPLRIEIEVDEGQTYTMDVIPGAPAATMTIIFQNNFGVDEYLYPTGKVTKKQSLQRQTAFVDRLQQIYSQTETIELTVDSGRVTDEELPMWLDMIRSRNVRLIQADGSEEPVIIKQEKVDISSEDDAMHRLQITFQPSNQTQELIVDSQTSRIFDGTFDQTFE